MQEWTNGKSQKYSFSGDELFDCLNEIVDDVHRYYKPDLHVDFVTDTDVGEALMAYDCPVGSIMHKFSPVHISLGGKSLVEHLRDDGLVRNEDVLRLIFQMHHESAHVWQRSVGYMQPAETSTDLMKNMAKTRAVMSCFGSYDALAYVLDSSEIMANQHACVRTKDFVLSKAKDDPRFFDLDVDSYVCNFCKRLYGASWPEVHSCKTSEDMANVLSDMMVEAPYRKTFDFNRLNIFQRSFTGPSRFRKFLDTDSTVFNVAGAADGIDEKNLMCKYIAKTHPDVFRGLLCIKDEYLQGSTRAAVERVLGSALRVVSQPWVDLIPKEEVDNCSPDF